MQARVSLFLRRHLRLVAPLLVLTAAAATPASAGANSVHLYETTWNMPAGSHPTAQAVDKDGNLYVFNQGDLTVTRYDSNGNPAPFPALGTNVIDGKGGNNCPATPTDCDRVPLGKFIPIGSCGAGCTHPLTLAVDSSDGPASGYIYVENAGNGVGGTEKLPYPNASTEVFAPSGEFVGQLRTNSDNPWHIGNNPASINVDGEGNVYLKHGRFNYVAILDKFTPIDGTPEHDVFAGQIRNTHEPSEMQGGIPYSYANAAEGQYGPIWAYDQSQFFTVDRSLGGYFPSEPLPMRPAGSGTGSSGGFGVWTGITIDPATSHVYFRTSDLISEWDAQGRQVGNDFGPPHVSAYETQFNGFSTSATENMAVDGSTTATRGRVYVQGSQNGGDSIAVFSPPEPTPDIVYDSESVSHDSAQIEADVQLAGGPPVTGCKLEWGTTVYGYERKPVPCTPATPYGSEQHVSISLSNLPTEQKIHYRITATNVNGVSYGDRQEIQPHAVLDLTTDPATDVTANTATLNASFDPDGLETAYYFEFGIDDSYGSKSSMVVGPQNGGFQSVTGIEVAKLQPGFTYHYRAVAENELGTSYGQDRVFVPVMAPRITAVRARNVTGDSADLYASIDPVGSATTYHFEYGKTRSYGLSTPEEEIPAGTENVPVTAHIEGLGAGVTYFRVVATNGTGTRVGEDASFSYEPPSCPNAHVRQQTGANYLPDCRAYELVSPPNAGSAYLLPGDTVFDAFVGFSAPSQWKFAPVNTGLSSSLPRFNFWSGNSSLPGVEASNFVADMYISTRTNEGWNTVHPAPRSSEVFLVGNEQCADDLSLCLSRPSFFIPGTFGEARVSNAPFLYDATSGRSLGRLPTNVDVVKGGYDFTGDGRASGDFSHYVFTSLDVAFAVGGLTTSPGTVYDNDIDNGTLQIVSKLPNGQPIPQDPASAGNAADYLDIPFISTHGSRILMGARTIPRCQIPRQDENCNNPNAPQQLYMRADGITYAVSRGEAVRIADVGQDGQVVYFTTPKQLDPADTDSSSDLYRWTLGGDELDLISVGADGSGQGDDCSVSWTTGCGVVPLRSCDVVYTLDSCTAQWWAFPTERPDIDNGTARASGATLFYSPEQLDPDNPGIAEARNLYLYRNGKPQYVTTFDAGTEAERYNVSPDGRYVAFVTRARLTPYDNVGSLQVFCNRNISRPRGQTNAFDPGEPGVACREMYRFDAETNTLQCVSCNPEDKGPAGDVQAAMGGPFLADDGRVFFTSKDALVPSDSDGLYSVYEYVEGRAQLISSGTGVEDHFPGLDDTLVFGPFYDPAYAGLESVSADGRDVFFSTYDSLVPTDQNGKFLKFYDARTNGGFPYQVPPLPCEAADECHAPSNAAPAEPAVGSGAVLAGGNLEPAKPKKHGKKHRPKRRKRNKRHAHGATRHGGVR